jgi:adenosine deaminase
MLDRDMRVTINSDDPAYFPGYVGDDLLAVQAAAGLSRGEVVQLVRNAFTIAWLDEEERSRYLDTVDAYASAS